MTDFANNLKYLRKLHNLSQQDIANKTGINQRMYSNYENGKSTPNLDVLVTLASFFRVSIDVLVGFTLEHLAGKDEDYELYD